MIDSLTISNLLVPLIIFVVSFFIFLVLILIAVVQWIKVVSARRWPVVPGTVLESYVLDSRDSHGRRYYRPMITYEYQVAGQRYTNNQLAFGSRSLSEGGAAVQTRAYETVAQYTVGGPVKVHHHPRNPARSVLEIRSVMAKWLVLAGLIFWFAGTIAAGVVLIINVAT